jgi:hypothetical protein
MPEWADHTTPAFLSHSSANKSFVDGVFAALGPSIAEYDDKTFPAGKFNTEAMRDAIARSNLFVLFATRQSLDSGFVEYEINIANELLASRRIRQILTFCIDGVSPRTLTPLIMVRIRVPQPNLTFRQIGRVPRPMAGCDGGGFR